MMEPQGILLWATVVIRGRITYSALYIHNTHTQPCGVELCVCVCMDVWGYTCYRACDVWKNPAQCIDAKLTPDSRLQPPVFGFSGPPMFSKRICDVCQLKSWLALWQNDLFKSTFYLYHFVLGCVCLIVCVCLTTCGTSKVWTVKEQHRFTCHKGRGL